LAPTRPSRGDDRPSPRDPTPPRLVVALVRGLRGLRGQVRVELLTDRPEDRFEVGARLYLEGTPEVLTITDASPVADGPGWWLTFREIGDREAAERLRDVYLEIDAPEEPREPGRWYFHELEGLAVRSGGGEDLGTVVDIYRAGGAEVFVVRGPRGELDVPGVRGIVLDLAPDRGEMIVDLDALALDARPVEDDDYVRPRDRRPHKQPRKRAEGRAVPPVPSSAAPGGRSPSPRTRRPRPVGSAATKASPDGDAGPTTGSTAGPAPDA
jgi:16S rRNA processing protein RimM